MSDRSDSLSLEEQLAFERSKNAMLQHALAEEKARRVAAEDALEILRSTQGNHDHAGPEEEKLVNKVRWLFLFKESEDI
jgi:hypothetical protein